MTVYRNPIWRWGAVPPPVIETPPRSNAIRVLIGDRTGRVIAEVEPDVGPVSWRLNNPGRATLTFAKTDPKATEDNLRFGNRVLIQFADGLPDWGGVIDPPRNWTDGSIVVKVYSGEYILGFRQTDRGRYFSGASVGYIYQRLILEANAVVPTGVEIGSVWLGGNPHSPSYHFRNIAEICTASLTRRLSTADFVVVPALAAGYITFTAYLYERRGVDRTGVVLLESHNLASIGLKEQGPIVNSWDLAGEGSTWGDERLTAHAENAVSIERFGLREDSEICSGVSIQTTLDEVAANRLAESAWPRNVLSLVASNLSPAAFADYDVGDSVRALLHSYGFGGYDHMVRVLTREYVPAMGTCSLVVQEDDQ